MRSVATLPPLRRCGSGATTLKLKRAFAKCRTVYLLTATVANVFEKLGYMPLDRAQAPDAIPTSRDSRCFTRTRLS
jgi:N-acetylglutamate synthase-like GNAT family acetyltransferase